MKILMVNKFLYPKGGSETYIFKLGEQLSAMGNEVQYFGMEHEKRCVSNHAGAYTAEMDFHHASKIAKLTYPLKTIYSSEARKKIRLVLDDFKPDIVHINNFNYQLTPSIILEIVSWRKKTHKKCKIFFTAHDTNLVCPNHMLFLPEKNEICECCIGGHYIQCLKHKCIHGSTSKSLIGTMEGYYWKLRKTYRNFDCVVCCSEFMKTKMDTNPLLVGKTIAMHNFIDSVAHKDVKKQDYVLYFGRYSAEKGIAGLVEVCRQLPHIRFVFAGSGPLEELVNGVPNIKNVGFRTGADLEKLIREARFSLCPSVCYENCPFSVMESIMYETPVLGSRIGGIPELIEDGKTGELFESGDFDGLKKKIDALWNDPDKVAAYTANCRDNNYDTAREYCEKLLKLYRAR